MIDLRKSGDKPRKTYNKYVDNMSDEQRSILDQIDQSLDPMLAAKSAIAKTKFDPQKPMESEFYKQLVRIISPGTKKDKLDLDEIRSKAIDNIMKNKEKPTIESAPDLNDAIKKINSLMLNTGGNGHVTNAAYLSALSTLSNMLIDVKDTIERRDRALLKQVHELNSSGVKNELLELLDK